MKKKILELLHASPFVPFTIQLSSGQGYRVEDPNFVLAASEAPHVIVEEKDGHVHTLNIDLVTSLVEEPAKRVEAQP